MLLKKGGSSLYFLKANNSCREFGGKISLPKTFCSLNFQLKHPNESIRLVKTCQFVFVFCLAVVFRANKSNMFTITTPIIIESYLSAGNENCTRKVFFSDPKCFEVFQANARLAYL